jgi:hypothetical protein
LNGVCQVQKTKLDFERCKEDFGIFLCGGVVVAVEGHVNLLSIWSMEREKKKGGNSLSENIDLYFSLCRSVALSLCQNKKKKKKKKK